jgi:hypothetical protein
MLLAEEMFVRGIVTQRELVRLESTLGTEHSATQLSAVIDFFKSGDWKNSTPALNKARKELRKGYVETNGYPCPSARTAPPRTIPLKGSKAVEQQEAGWGPGGHPRHDRRSRPGPGSPEFLAKLKLELSKLERQRDNLENQIGDFQNQISNFGKIGQ